MPSTKECWAPPLLQHKQFCDEKGMEYFIGKEIKVDFDLEQFKRIYRDTSIKTSATAYICDPLEDVKLCMLFPQL
jgi:hypothetical protein